MKRYLFFVILGLLVLCGCRSMDNYIKCKGDTDCVALMQKNGEISSKIVGGAVSATSDNGIANVAGQVAYAVASFLTGVLVGGRKKKVG